MRYIRLFFLLLAFIFLTGCTAGEMPDAQIAATTGPVSQFAQTIAEGTPITVSQVISDNVSCLHDYSLSVAQMTILEQSELVLLSGVGLEAFMADMTAEKNTADCSQGIELLPMRGHEGHSHQDHDHGHYDPHIWLSPKNAQIIAENICTALTAYAPDYAGTFRANTDVLQTRLAQLQADGQAALKNLSCRKLITFHDGFAYLAQSFDLEILETIEEESGSQISAKELIHLAELTERHHLPAVFTEKNGSVSAASVICAETGVKSYPLDMAMGGSNYFTAMESNIRVLKEALQ